MWRELDRENRRMLRNEGILLGREGGGEGGRRNFKASPSANEGEEEAPQSGNAGGEEIKNDGGRKKGG